MKASPLIAAHFLVLNLIKNNPVNDGLKAKLPRLLLSLTITSLFLLKRKAVALEIAIFHKAFGKRCITPRKFTSMHK